MDALRVLKHSSIRGTRLIFHYMSHEQTKKYNRAGEHMKFKHIDGLTDKETQAIVQQVHDAYDNSQTISLPNPHYRELQATERFLAPSAAREEQRGVEPQPLQENRQSFA